MRNNDIAGGSITHLCKPSKLIVDRPNSLLYSFFECPPNAHNLTNTFHAATQESTDAIELLEIPTRYFDHNIIQARFKTCTGDFGD